MNINLLHLLVESKAFFAITRVISMTGLIFLNKSNRIGRSTLSHECIKANRTNFVKGKIFSGHFNISSSHLTGFIKIRNLPGSIYQPPGDLS